MIVYKKKVGDYPSRKDKTMKEYARVYKSALNEYKGEHIVELTNPFDQWRFREAVNGIFLYKQGGRYPVQTKSGIDTIKAALGAMGIKLEEAEI